MPVFSQYVMEVPKAEIRRLDEGDKVTVTELGDNFTLELREYDDGEMIREGDNEIKTLYGEIISVDEGLKGLRQKGDNYEPSLDQVVDIVE